VSDSSNQCDYESVAFHFTHNICDIIQSYYVIARTLLHPSVSSFRLTGLKWKKLD